MKRERTDTALKLLGEVLKAQRAGTATLPSKLHLAIVACVEGEDEAHLIDLGVVSKPRLDMPLIDAQEAARKVVAALKREDAAKNPPRTVVGKGIRALKAALDRKALAALVVLMGCDDHEITVLGAEALEDDSIKHLLDVSEPSWKSALREGWIRETAGGLHYVLTETGCVLGRLLVNAKPDKLNSGLTVTWETLLGATL